LSEGYYYKGKIIAGSRKNDVLSWVLEKLLELTHYPFRMISVRAVSRYIFEFPLKSHHHAMQLYPALWKRPSSEVWLIPIVIEYDVLILLSGW
jgi:hypothetical protein